MADEPKIASVLAADIGNTYITLGCVLGEAVLVTRKVPTNDLSSLGDALAELWEAMDHPRRLAASSVNPSALTVLEKVAQERLDQPVTVVGRDIPLPIETSLDEPEKIGVDRLCSAAAAYNRLNQACIVADFGTAITIDCVNDEGVFIGGSILPGMRLQVESLHEKTAQLPLVELADPTWVFGRNTKEAIVGGIVRGTRGAMRELVEAYATELAVWPLVICTGGDASLIGRDEGLVQAIVPELCLIGIALAFYKSLLPIDEPGEEQPEEQ